jgi:hypothetical protein
MRDAFERIGREPRALRIFQILEIRRLGHAAQQRARFRAREAPEGGDAGQGLKGRGAQPRRAGGRPGRPALPYCRYRVFCHFTLIIEPPGAKVNFDAAAQGCGKFSQRLDRRNVKTRLETRNSSSKFRSRTMEHNEVGDRNC